MILDDFGTVLAAAGVGVLGTTLFLQFLPPDPDTCTALFEYGGSAGVHKMGASPNGAVVTHPSVQIVSRSTDPVVARTVAEQAYTALDGFSGTVSGTRYGWVEANQPPFYVHRDELDRWVMAFNVHVSKHRTP